ncbi:hypothetical protein [Sandaracinus amylolyticus]|uniref:hypothetical protein n=1 Tax=Sandaracinus amylolyticus TaxID=927083 RepID=UPI001F45432D|nr:hypothetical protein [Sandaracinus amylolyticus]UJR85610.1 Hypothetical protein I5071_76900 [Sandaracinus amylolyticus]
MRHAIVLALLATGCVGQLGGDLRDDPRPIDPDPQPIRVSLASAPALEPDGACVTLRDGETLLDTSPEGDAWLASDEGLRVVARDGTEWALPYAPAARPTYLVAHDARAATWIANGLVERAVPGGLRRVHVPAETGTPRWLCGDPEAHGPFFLATEHGLHAREGGQFWRYAVDGDALSPAFPFALASGACTSSTQELWLSDGAGAWRLDLNDAAPALRALEAIPAGLAIVREGVLAAAAGDDALFVIEGSASSEIVFEEGVPASVSIGGGRVWARLPTMIARRDRDGAWSRIDLASDDLHADATGAAWSLAGTELCRLETGATLSITGLVPDDRVSGARALVITTSAMAASTQVTIDGNVVFDADDASTTFDAGELPMGAAGWHELVATAEIDGAEVSRTLAYEVIDTAPLSFERDVAPFVATHCVACHAEDAPSRVRLDTYDSFRARAPSALARMGRGEMPPSPMDPAPAEMVRTVERWIEGGMMP